MELTIILPSDFAPEGAVTVLTHYSTSSFPPSSAILCRNAAPLVGFCYALLQRDIPCRLLGKDIGAQLSSLVRKIRAPDLRSFREKLSQWATRTADAVISEDKSPEWIYDQRDCLIFFLSSLDEDSQSVADLLAKIDQLFTNDNSESTKITLSTVHKAKGLEYSNVFILDREKYMPSRWAKQKWEKEQERNLLYVAVTRAKENLFYINSDCWKD